MRHQTLISVLVQNPLFGGIAYANDLDMALYDAQLELLRQAEGEDLEAQSED
jgi:hypothetical protein